MIRNLRSAPDKPTSALGRYLAQFEGLRDRSAADLAVVNALRLKRADALMKAVFESTFDGILIVRHDGRIEVANAAAAALFGCAREALVDRPAAELIPELARETAEEAALSRPVAGYHEALGRRRDGAEFPLEVIVSAIRFGDAAMTVAVLRDITDRKRQQEALKHQALHDALTGLPNRVLLLERLERALAGAERSGTPAALLMLDLDRFKEINDTLGHHVGDSLLRDVASRLAAALRATDTIARLGGDDFAVLLPSVHHLDEAREVAARLVEALRAPFAFSGLVIEVRLSIGIALYPEHAGEKDRLLQCADVAMYAAKHDQSIVAVYNGAKDHNSIRHLTLTGQLRQAIEDRQIFLHYQPKLDLTTGGPAGVEALARWQHPVHGTIAPAEFIAQAERTGLIHPLTELILETAVGQLARWRSQGFDISVAVNLSAKGLHNSALPRLLDRVLSAWRVAPEHVTLEITESAIMLDPAKALRVAQTMAGMGLRLSIDDFGTGYSSLSYLSRLPASELKIDKSFVSRMTLKQQDATIVQSTIDLAHNLGLKVVAEGVETLDIVRELMALGCDCAQGYYIGPPMGVEDTLAWLDHPIPNDLVRAADERLRVSG